MFHGAIYPVDITLNSRHPAPHGVPASIDFETRSTVDLKSAGARKYAQHPDTRVLCLFVAVGPAEAIWVPGMPIPPILADAIERGEIIQAWNAGFEIAIWQEIMVKRHGWPDLPPDRFRCTMQKAALVGCPGALERACVALGLPIDKDMNGHRLMLKMCKPLPVRKNDTPGAVRWHDDPLDHLKLQRYCRDDVRAEMAADAALPAPPPMEVAVMRVDREINLRGIRVDRAAAEGAAKIAREEKKRLNSEMFRITNGAIKSTNQVAVILDFVQQRGIQIDALRAADVRDILNDIDESSTSGDLDVTDEQIDAYSTMHGAEDTAVQVLRLRSEAAKASTAKLDALVKGASAGDLMTDLFAYSGAYRTQRWAGRRFQAHNLPRANPPCQTEDEIERWYETLASGRYDDFYDLLPMGKNGTRMTVMDGLKASLRGFLLASTACNMVVADLGQIEARGAAWLAGQWDLVQAFERLDAAAARGASEAEVKDMDIYTVNGRKMGVDRTGGKISTLACGYGGGWNALMVFAAAYGTVFTEEEARNIVDAYRAANPMIVRAWAAEERAAVQAMENPGMVVELTNGRNFVGAYCFKGGNLMRRLPSGRCLIYRKMRREPQSTPWGKMRMTLTYEGNIFAKGQPGVFVRLKTYGGKLFQNAVQAICRDILAAGLIRSQRYGLPIALHVHDEQGLDSPMHLNAEHAELVVQAATDPIDWVPGLPISSSADISKRYRKN